MQPRRFTLLFLVIVVLFSNVSFVAWASEQTIETADYPALRWRVETGSQLTDAPIIAGNVILQLSEDNFLYALDSSNGTELWRAETGNTDSQHAHVTTDADTAFISDTHSRLRAIDIATGETLWRRHTAPPQAQNPDYVPQFPPATVVEGVVYVDDIVDGDGIVYALDAKTGEEIWEAKTGPMESYQLPVVDGVVFVSDANGDLWFIDAATGKRRARYGTGEFLTAAPVVGEGMAFLALGGGRVDAIQSDSGKRQWSAQFHADFSTVVGISNGVLFVNLNGLPNQLLALDVSDGRTLWKLKTDDYNPTVEDGVVYVADAKGSLTAFDATSGATLWRGPTTLGSRTAVGDTLYVAIGSSLYALDATTGKERWRVRTGGMVGNSLTVTDDAIYLGGTDHFLYALNFQSQTSPPEGFAGSPIGATSKSFSTVQLEPLPETPAFAGIWRVTVPGNGSGTIPALNGPAAGYIQSGSLAFPDAALKVDENSPDGYAPPVDSADKGTTFRLPLKAPLAVVNPKDDAAEVLVFGILPEDGLPVTGEERGVTIDLVGGGKVETLPGDAAWVDLNSFRLDPGAALVPTLSTWPDVFFVESGSLVLALENNPSGKAGRSQTKVSSTTTLAAGDGTVLPAGTLRFARAGAKPTTILQLAVSGDIHLGQGGSCGGRCIQATR